MVHDNLDKTLPTVNRKSEIFSSMTKKSQHERFKSMMKTNNKNIENRFHTLGGETLHFGNTLNLTTVECFKMPIK